MENNLFYMLPEDCLRLIYKFSFDECIKELYIKTENIRYDEYMSSDEAYAEYLNELNEEYELGMIDSDMSDCDDDDDDY